MGAKLGPRIVADNLVLSLDCADAKSYAGEPVTNLYGDISTSTALRPNRTEYNTSGTWTTDMPMCPENVGRVYKHTSGALTSSWSGNSYGYMLKDIATTSGETYIVTCWVYVSSDCNISTCPVVIEQEASGESTISGYAGGYDFNNKGTWQLIAKKCVADDQVRFIPLYPSRTGVTDGSFSGFFAWGGAQVVKASYVTPYVLSSRSATDGWVDLSGNSNDGTLVNGVVTGASHYRSGDVILPNSARYLDFDGSDDHINISHNSAFDTNIFTIEIWFKSTTDDNTHDSLITRNGDVYSSANGWSLGKLRNGLGSTTNALRWLVWGTSTFTDLAGDSTASGNWTQAVGVSDGTNLYLYQNGVQKASGSKPAGNIYPSVYGFKIGANKSSSDIWNGQIANVKFYSDALSASEVLDNYNSTKSRFS